MFVDLYKTCFKGINVENKFHNYCFENLIKTIIRNKKIF